MDKEKYLRLSLEYFEADKKVSDYFRQFLYEYKDFGNGRFTEKKPTKNLSVKEFKILDKFRGDRDEKEKKLAEFLRSNQ